MTDTVQSFSLKGRRRRIPLLILALHARLPLVWQGGLLPTGQIDSDELREDFHDVEAVGWRLCGVYHFNPCSGEPYARWL